MDLATRLRRMRKGRQMRQADVAAEIGVDQSTISSWEDGGPVDKRYFDAIADFLGIPLSEVVTLVFELNRDEPVDVFAEPRPAEASPALQGKIEQLSPADRKYVEELVDRLLGQAR